MKTAQLMAGADDIAKSATRRGQVLYAFKDLGDGVSGDDLRTLALDVRSKIAESEPAVVAIFGQSKGRPLVVVATNEAARESGVKAGALVKVAWVFLAAEAAARTMLRRAVARMPRRSPRHRMR